MRRLLAVLPALALLAACESTSPVAPAATRVLPASAVAKSAGASQNDNSPVGVGLEFGYIPPNCLPESLYFSATTLNVYHEAQSTAGNARTVVHANLLRPPTLVGLTTGTQYRVVEVSNTTSNADFYQYATVSNYRIILPGSGPEVVFRYTTTFNYDPATGAVKEAHSTAQAVCGG